MPDQRNLILAIVLSVAIILIFQLLAPPEKRPAPPPTGQTTGAVPVPGTPARPTPKAPSAPATPGTATAPTPGATPGARPTVDRADLIGKTPRVTIDTPRVKGSMSLKGAVFDDLILLNYKQTLEKGSPNVELLQPKGSANAYYVEFGWTPDPKEKTAVPDAETVWRADHKVLAPDQPVRLTWDNGRGLTFVRTYSIDKNYMITVTQKVENKGATPVTLFPFAFMRRHGKPETLDFYILHEGPLGVFRESADKSGTLDELSYEDLRDAANDESPSKRAIQKQTVGGWLGITDHYWLVALIPNQAKAFSTRFLYLKDTDTYQADYLGESQRIEPGGSTEVISHLFAGAKAIGLIDAYQEQYKIANFELSIDFGWFYFLTRPLLLLLNWFHGWVGNMGVAILLLTVLVKVAFFPLANKSYKSMGQMKRLQPELVKLRERYKEDKQRLNQEMMALYKREKVSPASGCLPMLIQIPVFFALYKVLFVAIEMRHAPFFGWIRDLSAPDPTSILNLFGLLPWDAPTTGMLAFLSIGVWPLIMGLSMWLQMKLNPAPPDPVQAKIFAWLPVVFTFMLARFSSGLVIYWAWNNILSMGQQWLIMKRHGAFGTRPKGPATNVKDLKADGAGGAGAGKPGSGRSKQTGSLAKGQQQGSNRPGGSGGRQAVNRKRRGKRKKAKAGR